MSLVDFDNIQDQHLIVQYVIECRKVGHFLPYDDYQIIQNWLQICDDPDRLLLVLEEHLPAYFAKHEKKPQLPNLRGIEKKVSKSLLHQRLATKYE
ncbi:MAG: hypothetical protein ACOH5I_04930 [Oligoflexus sp.]